ncbi:hypothetical protein [Desulfocurvus vexinensis]|nr:hypothetical protein [Desulfocurvus vexinensis]
MLDARHCREAVEQARDAPWEAAPGGTPDTAPRAGRKREETP